MNPTVTISSGISISVEGTLSIPPRCRLEFRSTDSEPVAHVHAFAGRDGNESSMAKLEMIG